MKQFYRNCIKHMRYTPILVLALIATIDVATIGTMSTVAVTPMLTGCSGECSPSSCLDNCDSLLTGKINLKQFWQRITGGISCGDICTMEIEFVDEGGNQLSNVCDNGTGTFVTLGINDNGSIETIYNNFISVNSDGGATMSLSPCISVSDLRNGQVSIDPSTTLANGFIYVHKPGGGCEIYAEEWNSSGKLFFDAANCAVGLIITCKDTGHSGPCPNGC